MTPVASLSAVTPSPRVALGTPSPAAAEPSEMREAFQQAVGGLFFGQLIKALRSGVGKPAYLHGGQAEDLFQAQMDQHFAESLSKSHGAPLVEELYQRFLVDHPEGAKDTDSALLSLTQSSKSALQAEPVQEASWARPLNSGSRNTIDTAVIPALNRK